MKINDEPTLEEIKDALHEPRPLPMGRKEFEEWSDRIIAGAMVGATPRSLKWTLAGCIMHLGPTEDHKPDIYFIKQLRKFAANQTAHMMMEEIKADAKRELEEANQNTEPKLHVVDNMNEKKDG